MSNQELITNAIANMSNEEKAADLSAYQLEPTSL